ncbi:hypothetical protein JYQ74_14610, partial [Anaerostipes hadrus]|nr:hypothetical protein [Anaerostipes hadrus]
MDQIVTNPTIDKILAEVLFFLVTPVFWWGLFGRLKLTIIRGSGAVWRLKIKKLEQSLWEDPRWIVSSMG